MELSKITDAVNGGAVLREYLCSVSDEGYRAFQAALVPGAGGSIIGVRVPELRRIAKEISKADAAAYLACPCGDTFEERVIYGLVLASMKCGAEELKADILKYAGMVTNWAENDIVSFKGIKKYREEIKGMIDTLLFGGGPWQTRYGLKILMDYYIDDEYIDYTLEKTAAVKSGEYYVYMMQGWLLATAAVSYGEKVIGLLKAGTDALTKQAICAAADKMRDSRRISKEDKDRVQRIKRAIKGPGKGGKDNAEK